MTEQPVPTAPPATPGPVPAVPARQVGAEQGKPCPTCGAQMVVTETAYGSLVARCPACNEKNAAPATQTASEQALPRETGTTVAAPAVAPPTAQEG